MAEDSFGKLDMQHKGYVTKEEYLKIIVPALGEERSSALFDAMDTNHNGKVQQPSRVWYPCLLRGGSAQFI